MNCFATSNSDELTPEDSSTTNTISAMYPRQLVGVGREVCEILGKKKKKKKTPNFGSKKFCHTKD